MESLQKLGVKPLFTTILNKTQTKFVVSSGSVIYFTGEAIVNAANTGCLGGDGIDGAINARGGTELRLARESLPEISEGVRCPEGEVRVTIGGDLSAKYIIHAVGPIYPKEGPYSAHDSVLSRAYQNSLVEGQKKGIKTIAFSLLGAGIFKGGRSLEDVLLIGVETVVQCVYDGLEELHMIASSEKERAALLRTAQIFFNHQADKDVSKKIDGRSKPIEEERPAKRQKTMPVEVLELETLGSDDASKTGDTVVPVHQRNPLMTPGEVQQLNSLSKKTTSTPKLDAENSHVSVPRHQSSSAVSLPTKEGQGLKVSTPVNVKTVSEGGDVQATPIYIKRSYRIQILLITMDEWFEHIFKKYLDNPQRILNCFPGCPLTALQQKHIIAAFKTIYPQLRVKLRSNMNCWVERRNLVQLFADVDKMIATQCSTPGGSRFRPPVESAEHLKAMYELKIIHKAEKEVDAKIVETKSELSELRKILEELKKEDYNTKGPNLDGSSSTKILNNMKAISEEKEVKSSSI